MSEKDLFGLEIPPHFQRHIAEQNFRDGDPLAVESCVLACHEDGEAIPDWAVEELARRARIKLGIDENPSKKGGRHTNPTVQQRDKRERRAICCAVLGAREFGCKKEESYDKAKELLARGPNLNFERNSIKTIFMRHGSKYRESPYISTYRAILELLEDGRFDEFIEEHNVNLNKLL